MNRKLPVVLSKTGRSRSLNREQEIHAFSDLHLIHFAQHQSTRKSQSINILLDLVTVKIISYTLVRCKQLVITRAKLVNANSEHCSLSPAYTHSKIKQSHPENACTIEHWGFNGINRQSSHRCRIRRSNNCGQQLLFIKSALEVRKNIVI